MEKLAENDLPYFYLHHVVIVVTAVTTISLTPVIVEEEVDIVVSASQRPQSNLT
jgi:aspartate aminotransferase-like enzyme